MTEHAHDSSDQDKHIDKEFITTLEQIDSLVQQYIRSKIGDYAFEAFEARKQLENELDDTLGAEVRDGLGSRQEVFTRRAAALAADMINEGEPEKEAKERASDLALVEMLDQAINPADEHYFDAFGEVLDKLSGIIEPELAKKYRGLIVDSVDGGMLTIGRWPKDKTDTTFHISFISNGEQLTTRIFYFMTSDVQELGVTSKIVDVDPADFGNVIEDMDVATLKEDVLAALRIALERIDADS